MRKKDSSGKRTMKKLGVFLKRQKYEWNMSLGKK